MKPEMEIEKGMETQQKRSTVDTCQRLRQRKARNRDIIYIGYRGCDSKI